MRAAAGRLAWAVVALVTLAGLATSASAQPDESDAREGAPPVSATARGTPPSDDEEGGGKPSTPAQAPEIVDQTPAIRRQWSLGDLAGRPVRRVEIVTEGGLWPSEPSLERVRPDEPLTGEVARRAMRELTESGRYARVRADAVAEGDGVLLRLIVLPRKIVARIRVAGGSLDRVTMLRAAGVREGSEVTAPTLTEFRERSEAFYERHGFPQARVEVQPIDTDDPTKVVLLVDVTPGPALHVVGRSFKLSPADVGGLGEVVRGYDVDEGDRADRDVLDEADQELVTTLAERGWPRARVRHRLVPWKGGTHLWVFVDAGPLLRMRFDGNRDFDDDQLESALELDEAEDRSPQALADRVRGFYVQRGFLDAEVSVTEVGGPKDPVHDLVFAVRRNQRARVAHREFPCLDVDAPVRGNLEAKERSPDDIGSEIDSFLSEELPGGVLFGGTSPVVVDDTFGPRGETGARPEPTRLNPWDTYVPEVYARALEHVQDLYRSEGFLSATVGPAVVLRRRCHPRSLPGQCIPMGPLRRPPVTCYGAEGMPATDPLPDDSLACTPDPARGIRCDPSIVLHIPIKRGPQTELYDVAFEGNDQLVEARLAEVAELELGEPVSQVEVEAARRRVLDEYAEEGFAFADVAVVLDLSPDQTRARARFVISERERVIVTDVRVRGADRTNESLILRRVALERGEPYRRSLVRKTEERLATLGVFSSVVVGLEDPYIPAREKAVVITVQERRAQYIAPAAGLSTGEGFRTGFDYGHLNIGGEAIQFTLNIRFNILPSVFIFQDDVRRKFDALPLSKRLERRNRAGVEFPEIGLGPLIRLGVDAVDVRDNARDYGLTKEALIVTLKYRPTTRFTAQLGTSIEINNAEIFTGESLDEFLRVNNNPNLTRLLRVPEGRTFVVAERLGFTWDERDNPFDATRGTLLSADVEHVNAFPAANNPNTITSDFLRFTGRVAGYVRLTNRGLALAMSMRSGYNVQLRTESRTYPDRLHFLGGVDSLRGFFQDSVVPQDVADEILDPSNPLTIRDVAIRGADVSLNPRTELRIPVTSVFSTAVFLDAGNLWVEPSSIEPFRMRYTAGSGIRAGTPIGPLAFDYGINLNRRPWETFGAFHFSIGLF